VSRAREPRHRYPRGHVAREHASDQGPVDRNGLRTERFDESLDEAPHLVDVHPGEKPAHPDVRAGDRDEQGLAVLSTPNVLMSALVSGDRTA
jgi:hypothetical protein